MMSEGAMADWTGLYLQRSTGSTEAVAAIGYSAFSIAMAVGRFFGDDITVRLGPVRILRYGGRLALASLAIALLFPVTAVALLSFVCVGAGLAIMVPQVFTAAAAVPGANPSVAVATVSTLGYFGFLLGPPCIGFAAQAFGLRTALWIIVAVCAVLVGLAPKVRPDAAAARARGSGRSLMEELA
jgi:fucose permease